MSDTILLAVTGMSPAILTETVWALAHPTDGTEPVIPTRVIAVTTVQGRVQLGQLFQPAPGLGGQSPWEALRRALAGRGHELTGRLRFGETADDIRVLTAADPATGQSRELADLRTPADNAAAADFLLETVRAVVENPDTQLVASLAGGRKTMGALLYACLTLVGRETDRLTHVLVSEPFETLRDFWFPGQPGGPLAQAGRAGALPADPAAAVVQLAEVPFVPLRNLFERELGRKAGSFLRLIETGRSGLRQHAAQQLRVTLDAGRRALEVNGVGVALSATECLLLLFLARRAKRGEPPFAAYKDVLDPLNDFRREQAASTPELSDWRQADSLRAEWDDRTVTKTVSGVREKLRQAGGPAALLAACLPEKGRCSLDLEPRLIFLK
jgi:CRISPR-associated protein (TIGR02584 family)